MNVHRSLVSLTRLCSFLLIIGASAEASARWLWVNGAHKGKGCEVTRRVFESALTTHLSELTQNTLTFDGQLLACDSNRCAESRLLSAGGALALFNQSRCIKGKLDYELRVINVDQKTLVYLSSAHSEMSHKDIRERAQQLARRLSRGPKPSPIKAPIQNKSAMGLSLGVVTPNIAEYDTSGTTLRFDYDRVWTSRPDFVTRFGLAHSYQAENRFTRNMTRLETGILYLPTTPGVSPWIGAGLSLGFLTHQSLRKRVLASSEDAVIKATVTEKERVNENITLHGWLESGIMLNRGSLQPNISTRFYFMNFGDGAVAELCVLFGFRWL